MTVLIGGCKSALTLCLLLCHALPGKAEKLSRAEMTCIVYGPGLDSVSLSLPVQYFFVQLVAPNGTNVTDTVSRNSLFVELVGKPNPCMVRSEVIDRHDGTYIVRYKVFDTCAGLLLIISGINGIRLRSFNYTIRGPIAPMECKCPITIDRWLEKARCPPEFASQISNHASTWPPGSVDLLVALKQARKKWAVYEKSFSFCHYKIRSPKLYRRCYGKYVGFNIFADEIFSYLLRKVQLPEMDLFINLGDWPLEKRVSNACSSNYVPMLSWCGSDDTVDIVLPTYEMVEAMMEMMGRHALELISAQGMRNVSWANKVNKAFWRGRDSSSMRLRLVNISRANPDLLDARITRFFFFRHMMDIYGPEVPTVSFQKFFDYKYAVNVDGTVAAYRFPFLMAGNSLILKQDSNYYEHFYSLLKPWTHFVPVRRDLSNLVDQIRWAMEHDARSRHIVANAQMFVDKFLLPKEVICYYVQALQAYSSLFRRPLPEIDELMEEVNITTSARIRCSCSAADYRVKTDL